MEARLTEVIAAKLPQALRGRRRFPPALLLGGAIVALLVLLAVFADVIAPYPFDQFHPRQRFSPPTLTWLAGTDEYGRDVFSRLLFGSQLSLMLGGIATLLSMAIGVPLGQFAGFRRGFADEAIMRTLDVMMAFPPIMLMLLILVVTPPSLLKTAMAIGALAVPAMARVTRSVTLDLMSGEFIEAARSEEHTSELQSHSDIVC